MKPFTNIFRLTLVIFIASCGNKNVTSDASGTFEATEIIVSSQVSGEILKSNILEGSLVQQGDVAFETDSVQLVLKRQQLMAQMKAVLSRRPDMNKQTQVFKEQLKQALNEQKRIEQLLSKGAATQKQKDDIDAQVRIVQSQLAASESGLMISSNSLSEETLPLKVQIDQINDQLSHCKVRHPVSGTVLNTYVETGEWVVPGKQLYKIADMREVYLRAYVTGDQFAALKLNQKVTVLTDDGKGGYKSTEGVISWISNKAEFTPKTIQTHDERANLVYAVKVRVRNTGDIKIGMYGELKF